MGSNEIEKFAYVLDLEDDVLILTSDERIQAPNVMFLMVEHEAIECRVYETNGLEDMQKWNFVTMYTGIMSSL